MDFDIAMCDELLTTTRAVRKRLDLDRPVPRSLINECLELAVQAPTRANTQIWRWLVVDDAHTRKALADLYRRGAAGYFGQAQASPQVQQDRQTQRVLDSALYLMEHLEKVPVHLIPCVIERPPDGAPLAQLSSLFGSIYPAIWSFQLALRARGLGSALTTLHLAQEKEAAALLGIPDHVLQVALLPVAYTKGTDFKRAARPPVASMTHWNTWST